MKIAGVNDDEDPPVPIPNTAVKLIGAEDTWRVTSWENRTVPAQIKATARFDLAVAFFCLLDGYSNPKTLRLFPEAVFIAKGVRMPGKFERKQGGATKQKGHTPAPSGDQIGENAEEGRFAKAAGSKEKGTKK